MTKFHIPALKKILQLFKYRLGLSSLTIKKLKWFTGALFQERSIPPAHGHDVVTRTMVPEYMVLPNLKSGITRQHPYPLFLNG